MGKKVLLISHYPPPAGGIASWTKRLLAIGLPDNWQISHINLNTIGGRDPFQNTKRNFKDEYTRTKNIWQQEIQALKTEKEISVVHTCIPCTPFGILRETGTSMIAKFYGKKMILHCRCTVPNVVNKGWKIVLWKILTHFCDGIMVLNTPSLQFAQKYSPKSQSILIPNFVAESELIDSSVLRIHKELKKIIYVGGVTAEKGCDTIILAAKDLPDMEFHLIGSPSEEIANMEKTKNVFLHGNRDQAYIKAMFRDADCFLFLSRYFGEGFSNALAEAMAAGLPCIVTDWAANADMIGFGGGIIIPQCDPNALISALHAMESEELRKSQSICNAEKVRREYVEKVVLCQYTSFYEHLTGNLH